MRSSSSTLSYSGFQNTIVATWKRTLSALSPDSIGLGKRTSATQVMHDHMSCMLSPAQEGLGPVTYSPAVCLMRSYSASADTPSIHAWRSATPPTPLSPSNKLICFPDHMTFIISTLQTIFPFHPPACLPPSSLHILNSELALHTSQASNSQAHPAAC